MIELVDMAGDRVAFGAGPGEHVPDLDELIRAVGDREHEPFDFGDGFAVALFQTLAFAFEFFRAPGAFEVVFADVDFDQLRIEHSGLQPGQYARFHHAHRDGAVVRARRRTPLAVARAAPVRDAPAIGAAHRPPAAADATARDPRKHVLGAARLFGALSARPAQQVLDGVPQFVFDDAEMRHRFDEPFACRIGADQGLAGARIDDLAGAVEDQLADVEPVLQDPVLALAIAVDRRRAPEAGGARSRLNRRHAVRIQALGDRARALAGGKFGEDAADDCSLIVVDLAQAADQFALFVEAVGLAVAVGDACRRALVGDRTALAALDLGREIAAELRVHQPAKGRGHFADFAVRKREDARAGEVDALADRKRVALVAGEAIGRFGEHLIDAARPDAGEQGVEPRPGGFVDPGGSADRGIGEDSGDFPSFAFAAFAAERDLIVDRSRVLQRAAEAGVDYGFH